MDTVPSLSEECACMGDAIRHLLSGCGGIIMCIHGSSNDRPIQTAVNTIIEIPLKINEHLKVATSNKIK